MNPFEFKENPGGKPPVILLLLLSAFVLPSLLGATPSLVRVIPQYREAVTFYRISEFFTQRENPGKHVILRTDPRQREGFYWEIRLRKGDEGILTDGALKIEVFYPDNPRPVEYLLDLPVLTRRQPLLLAGITGENWPEELRRPLAWRLSFLDAAENLIVSEQSFLWAPQNSDEE